MSETFKANQYHAQLRHRLLVTACAMALLSAVTIREAKADDADHPVLWIELGGAFDQISDGDTRWLPPNMTPSISKPPPGPFGRMPTAGYDADLKISFTPDDSDWIFSAAVRYGRAIRGPKKTHDQSYHFTVQTQSSAPIKYNLTNWDFANTAQRSRATYAIVDFQAGKDMGLGFFGGKSTLSGGIRVAKLNENAEGHLTAFISAPGKYSPREAVHKAAFAAKRSFEGLGPSVYWDGSTPFAGTLSEGFSFDWGANAAILFGRQKTDLSLRTRDARYYPGAGYPLYTSGTVKVLSQSTNTPSRNRTVIVPNIGGFAGLSWHLPNAKISLGYRADFFFGAIDGGLASAKTETRGFYGPFATLSVGIGG
jgi:hypothetical protein